MRKGEGWVPLAISLHLRENVVAACRPFNVLNNVGTAADVAAAAATAAAVVGGNDDGDVCESLSLSYRSREEAFSHPGSSNSNSTSLLQWKNCPEMTSFPVQLHLPILTIIIRPCIQHLHVHLQQFYSTWVIQVQASCSMLRLSQRSLRQQNVPHSMFAHFHVDQLTSSLTLDLPLFVVTIRCVPYPLYVCSF